MAGRRGRPPHPDILTPREWDVLALLRDGLTNEQIASRLDVSPATAKYHVSEILSKLGVATREEAAVWRPEVERRALWQRLWAASLAAKGAALLLAAAALLALGVLSWGILRTEGDGTETVLNTGTPSASPAEAATGTGTPPAPVAGQSFRKDASASAIAYFAEDGYAYLDEGVGGVRERLDATLPCSSSYRYESLAWFYSLAWSPDGSRLYCRGANAPWSVGVFVLMDGEGNQIAKLESPEISGEVWSPDSHLLLYFRQGSIIVLDSDLHQAAEIPGADRFWGMYPLRGAPYWSSDSANIAYYSPADDATHIFSLSALSDEASWPGYRPLAWLSDDSLFIGQGTWDFSLEHFNVSYEAYVAGVQTGTLARVPGLDYDSAAQGHSSQAWLLPDGERAVVVLSQWDGSGLPLGILDIGSGEIMEIAGSSIAYPSEGIPPGNIWLSEDGRYLYWTKIADGTSTQRADLETLVAEPVFETAALGQSVSPDGRAVAYSEAGETGTLTIANLDGSGSVEVAQVTSRLPGVGTAVPHAWRPTP
ncbi:MAG: helix-turn-helix transcriptional regulator [Dehalococcoidia bacterium]|nr:helix-turn-helix transcriptional regulator [Dehalococcoidia bacterium]